jgi:hypothetical protein
MYASVADIENALVCCISRCDCAGQKATWQMMDLQGFGDEGIYHQTSGVTDINRQYIVYYE